jgi:hypothetical protein
MTLNKRSRQAACLICVMLAGGEAVRADVESVSGLGPGDWPVEISRRNPFGLLSPLNLVSPPPVPRVPPPPLATVELTGMTSILSRKRALLEISPGAGKQMIRAILGEGETVESVEVVTIDIDNNRVMIRNGTLVTNLTIRVANGPARPGPRASLMPPGPPGTLPPRSGRTGVILAGGTPAYQPPTGSANPGSGQPRTMRSGLPEAAVGNAPLRPEAAVLEIERHRRMNPSNLPPLPPTPLTPRLAPWPGQ